MHKFIKSNPKKDKHKSIVTRKKFLKKALSLLGAVPLTSFLTMCTSSASGNKKEDDEQMGDKVFLKTITYNILGCMGWSPNETQLVKQARDMGQIPKRIALELSLYEPDIINFSECPEEAVVAEIADQLDMNYVYFQGGFPGSILTNYKIVNSENKPFVDGKQDDDLFTRHWGKAEIQISDSTNIMVHSAHLWPFNKSSDDSEIRLREISALLKSIERDTSNTESVLLQGDLNHTPGTPEQRKLLESMVDTFSRVGEGDGNTINTDKPTKRIDYIYARGPITEGISSSKPLFQGNFRINRDDPSSFALSDHLPQIAGFNVG